MPFWSVCGESEIWLVWMSAAATPAFFKAAMTAAAASAVRASALEAVCARVSTVKENEARSGTVVTVPCPLTVIAVFAGVSVERGSVRLQGHVESEKVARKVEALVRELPGVVEVDSYLRVG